MLARSGRLSSYFGNSLRATFQSVTVVIAALALAACATMVILTSLLHQLTATVGDSVESVHQLEEAQIALLRHARADDLLTKQDLETGIRERVERARAHAASKREQALMTDAQAQLESYFALSNALQLLPREVALQEQRAFSALETLVDFNVAQSNRARVRAREWDGLANVLGLGASALLLVVVVAALAWVRRRALRPLLSLSGAMNQFGRGEHDARATEDGPIELRDMSACFNEMAAAMAAQREARVALLGGIAHDLRTPLSALRLAVETLGPDHALPPEQQVRRLLAIIHRQIGRMDGMLGDFIDVSRIEAGERALTCAEHDAVKLVRDVVEIFDSAASRFRISLPERCVAVHVDHVRIGQVITNLVSNAIKYSPVETPIDIRLTTRADEAVIQVTDQGIGMSTEEQRHIFEPFRRVGRARDVPGVGLGLFMARRIVVAHGGRIEVESELGRGSTFRIYLPKPARAVGSATATARAHLARA